MEEDLFPNLMAVQSRADLEEERRLFYVAITRAEKRCTLSYAMSRYKWGNLTSGEPSRFIDEIDPQYVQLPKRYEAPQFGDRGSLSSGWSKPGNTSTRPTKPGTVFSREPRSAAPAAKLSHSPMQRGGAPATPATLGIDPEKLKKLKRVTSTGAPLEATSSLGHAAPADIAEGVTVEHEKFGKGKVIKVEGTPPDIKATIFFPSSGQKQLLLRFAKLTVVEG
jgi:DNA helicase-2/ATP-dependent DNA helicase PcrA